jgi:hypothetical protein
MRITKMRAGTSQELTTPEPRMSGLDKIIGTQTRTPSRHPLTSSLPEGHDSPASRGGARTMTTLSCQSCRTPSSTRATDNRGRVVGWDVCQARHNDVGADGSCQRHNGRMGNRA